MAVGIILGLESYEGEDAVLLQKRSTSDSYANGHQVSAHGKIEEVDLKQAEITGRDVFLIALLREVEEELGDAMAKLIVANEDQLVILGNTITPEKEIRTYGLDTGLTEEQLKRKLVLGDEVAGITVCIDPDKIRSYKEGEKQTGVQDGSIAMFLDEIRAVKSAFKKLFD